MIPVQIKISWSASSSVRVDSGFYVPMEDSKHTGKPPESATFCWAHTGKSTLQVNLNRIFDDCNRYTIYGFIYRLDLNGENNFFCGRVTAGGGEALVFVNIGALPALVDAVEVHMDATFRAPSTGYYQFASVHVIGLFHIAKIRLSKSGNACVF